MKTTVSKQLRCKGKLQGIMKEFPDGKKLLEVRCKEKWCADRVAGLIVLHYFNVETGELDHTKKFREPNRRKVN